MNANIHEYTREVNAVVPHEGTRQYNINISFKDGSVIIVAIETVSMEKYRVDIDPKQILGYTGDKVPMTPEQFYRFIKTSLQNIEKEETHMSCIVAAAQTVGTTVFTMQIPLKIMFAGLCNEHIIEIDLAQVVQSDAERMEAMIRAFKTVISTTTNVLPKNFKQDFPEEHEKICENSVDIRALKSEVKNCKERINGFDSWGLEQHQQLVSLKKIVEKHSSDIESLMKIVEKHNAEMSQMLKTMTTILSETTQKSDPFEITADEANRTFRKKIGNKVELKTDFDASDEETGTNAQ